MCAVAPRGAVRSGALSFFGALTQQATTSTTSTARWRGIAADLGALAAAVAALGMWVVALHVVGG
jgi:hypothetical protein